MAPQKQRPPQVICAENIAFLHLLHVVPSEPTTRIVQGNLKDCNARCLSLEQERHLTGTLAVLSCIKENIEYTTAVAIRELRTSRTSEQPTLQVLLAVNKSSSKSAEAYLEVSSQGLQRVLRALSRATQAYDARLELDVFEEIVSVCQERILSRLRFAKRKWKKQSPPLQNALNDMCTTLAGRNDSAALTFIQTTRSLITALDSYSKHQVESRIPGLVEEADTWTRLGDMSRLFSKVRSGPSATTTRVYQENRHIIRKVAQYRTAARRLYRLTRRCKPLRTAIVVPVRLGPKAFTQPDTTGYAPSLADTLERLTSMRSPDRLAAICKYVQKKNTDPKYDFLSTTQRTLENSSKVHAEVQILTHLRCVPAGQAFMPRFVQSNKKACFLCNQLLTLNGFPAIPKSHGKLYTGWRIPMLPVMEPLQRQLNASLEQKSRQSIELLLLKKQNIDLEHPYESSALSISDVAASEVLEVVPNIADAIGPLQESKESLIITVVELEELTIAQESSDDSEESDEEVSSTISEEDADERAEDQSSVIVTNDPEQHDPTHLHPTQVAWTIEQDQPSLVHTFNGSKLLMEYSAGTDTPEPKTLRYQTRRLEDAEIEALKATDSKIIAVTAMEKGSEITLQGNSPFHIDFGNAIAELVLYN